ncbi:putative lipid II flippase FtsW [Microbacterium gilvum]|uniref:Probable peptidoglycan glycosyltransferase FtsW n=1 Tax=Microbacterium gilvum TaxID=1336204 RepID=A0ABP8ZQB3_9MICO
MTQTTTPPSGTDGPRRALSARVSLGRALQPVPLEFLLILSAVVLLTAFGVVMITSATTVTSLQSGESPFDGGLSQLIVAVVGVPLMLVVSRMPVRVLRRFAWPALIGSLALQLLVILFGRAVGGNQNWIYIGGVSLQPSEFIKLALVIWIAAVLFRKRTLLTSWKHVFVPVIPVAVLAAGLILVGHDLGTAIVVVLIVLGAIFFSGASLRMFVLPTILGAVAVVALAVTSENRLKRILSLLNPDDLSCYLNDCYQPLHGIWGIASGGLFGLGLGNSKEKYDWLPAAADDYIFAIVGEELGLLGCLVVLGLFVVLGWAALRIVRRSDDLFVQIAAGGITVWIIGQALINIGVVLRVFPVLGVPLPFMSAGGSSLIALLVACGVLLACARTLPMRPDPARPPTRPGAARRA